MGAAVAGALSGIDEDIIAGTVMKTERERTEREREREERGGGGGDHRRH